MNRKRNGKKSALLALCLLMAIGLPFFSRNNYNQILMNQTIVYIIAVLGLNFTMGLSGQFDFSPAAIFGLGSYVTGLLSVKLGISPWLGTIAAVLFGLVIGVMIGYPSLRLKGVYFVLATLGFLEATRLLLTNMTWLTEGTNGVAGIPSYQLIGINFGNPRNFYYLALFFMIIAVVISKRVIDSKWGRMLIAIKDNDVAVEGCGIDKASIKIKAYILGSCFMTFAGAMNAHMFQFIHPSDFNFDFTVKFIMMLMLGGLGTIPGCVMGGIVVTILPEMLKFLGEYYWLAFSTLMLIMVMFIPYGFVSVPEFVRSKMKKHRERA